MTKINFVKKLKQRIEYDLAFIAAVMKFHKINEIEHIIELESGTKYKFTIKRLK